jgi:cysteine desulfuration protein SufE
MPTINEQAERLIDAFATFDDWQDRYGYIIDMGRKLPLPDEKDRTEENQVHGCQSRVWLVAETRRQDGENVLEFRADSDASIVKGLLALVHRLYSGQTAGEILAFDFGRFLERLQLDQNLSMTRGNGLRAVVQRIRHLAASQLAAEAQPVASPS